MTQLRPLASPIPDLSGARLLSVSLVSAHRNWTAMPSGEDLHDQMRAVAQSGDRQAFAILFKHFAPRVKSYLLRSGSADALAEELAQETMVTLWRKAAMFDPARAQLSTWVFTIARNLRVDALRRQHDAPADAAAPDDGDDGIATLADALHDAPSPDERLHGARREAAVRDALRRLPAEQLQVLFLSYYDEQPHARIAEDLRVPLGTVKSRLRLALGHLRRLLQEGQS